MIRSPNGDTDFFDIVTGVLQGDTLALYLFIIYLDDVLRTTIDLMKENGLILKKKKARSRRYSVETTTDAIEANDLAFLTNILVQAEFLQHSLKKKPCKNILPLHEFRKNIVHEF